MAQDNSLIIEGARLLFRNFAGNKTQYNGEGQRNFCVLLPDDIASQMVEDGWSVKTLKSRDEGDPDEPYIKVKVNFGGRPPKVVLINSRGRTDLTENEIEILDYADIKQADLIINPYSWEVNGKTGITAYLQSIFVTLNETELDMKYSDIQYADVQTPNSDIQE